MFAAASKRSMGNKANIYLRPRLKVSTVRKLMFVNQYLFNKVA